MPDNNVIQLTLWPDAPQPTDQSPSPQPDLLVEDSALGKDDLPENLRELAAVIGPDLMTKVIKIYGGEQIYIPKFDQIQARRQRQYRNAQIKSEFTGINHRQLARRYNLSESRIRYILSKS